MKRCKSVEFLSVFKMAISLHKRKAHLFATFCNSSVWTVHSNIYHRIHSYIKQPVSQLGFNTAPSWKSSLWPGCGKWNEQHNAVISVVSSATLAQRGLCLTSETMRSLKCSEMSKINSVTATEVVWRSSRSRSIWSVGSNKICKKPIFRFAISFKKQ